MGRLLRCSGRMTLLVGHVIRGWLCSLYWRIRLGRQWYDSEVGQSVIMDWARGFSGILGLRIDIQGEPSTGEPTLFIANHISWLDVVALSSIVGSRFIAKSDVRGWPVVGKLATRSGTLFVNRERKTAIRDAVVTVEQALVNQASVIVFPEGTTTTGCHVKPFHGGLFQAAINTGVSLQVIALRYHRDGSVDSLAPFVGDDTLPRHLFRILLQPYTQILITFGPVLATTGNSRHELASNARRHICDLLSLEPEAVAA